MVGAGVGLIVMLREIDESQPNEFVCNTLTVPLPVADQSTVMDVPLVLPMMLPPVTLQAYVLPEVGFVLYEACLYSQTVPLPVMVGAGVGLIVMLREID